MLAGLSIRDVVLIESLSLNFLPGLTVLTGETGAGKSILLDALALALGARADAGLVRHGAAQASVTAEFDPPPRHPAFGILAEQDIQAEGPLVIRRTVSADGRSRCFVNDQAVSAGLLRRLAETLVEIHGQFDTHGLFDPRTHRVTLDAYAGIGGRELAAAWRDWRAAESERTQLAADAESALKEESYLRDAVAELERLAPKPGEEATLAELRHRLQHREKLVDALAAAERDLTGDRSAELLLATARRALERVADRAAGSFDSILAALDRAQIEIAEAVAGIEAAGAAFDGETQDLTTVDDRLFDLRQAGRRYGVEADALPELRATLAERLAGLENYESRVAAAERLTAARRDAYAAAAAATTAARAKAARRLDAAVARELAPLKLDRARFATMVDPLPESEWGEAGADRVAFAVSTNPGQPLGPLAKIASGGELARFMLALKVVLASASSIPVLVFDEVDSGIGGATADAVGERLARLAETQQVLVVTHSPQVAARGAHHWQVRKSIKKGVMTTEVAPLDPAGRREEVARMLSGAEVTVEARAAAARLIDRPAPGRLL
jgi:DNA repair protein RecN (Recombination protein N)